MPEYASISGLGMGKMLVLMSGMGDNNGRAGMQRGIAFAIKINSRKQIVPRVGEKKKKKSRLWNQGRDFVTMCEVWGIGTVG